MATVKISGKKFGWVSRAIAARRNGTAEPGILEGWSATVNQVPQQLVVVTDSHVVMVTDEKDDRIAWSDVRSWVGGNTLVHADGQCTIRMTDRDEHDEFVKYLNDREVAEVPRGPVTIPMLREDRIVTLMSHPDIARPRPIGLVSGQVVTARHVFSDSLSDVSSVFGGRIGGIEKGITRGLEQSSVELRRNAHAMGADAVIGVDVSVQLVDDKAYLLMMVGTAVVDETQVLSP